MVIRNQLTVWLFFAAGCCATLVAADRPNILFLFGDDHAYDSIGLMSDGYVKTPTIDRLAAEGVYFERAYNMGAWSGAVCVASRTMLNTGTTLWNAERLFRANQVASRLSWSERLKAAGYSTYFTGKWHVKGYAPEKLFDRCGTIRPGMPRTEGDGNRPILGKDDQWSPSAPELGGYWEGGQHWSEVTTDETIDFLINYSKAESSEPFFAYVGFNAPHDPRQSPQAYLDMYPTESVPLPRSFMPSYPYTKEIGVWNVRAERLAPRPRTEFAIKTHRREYYALVSHLDAQLGRIIETLKAQGLYENTIVVYTSDHGLSLGNHSFMAKQSMYDHSLASPFIISGPGIPKAVRSQQRIFIQDIVPTTLELAGQSASEFKDIEFQSLLPLSDSGTGRQGTPIYGGYRDFSRCVVDGQWKLIHYVEIDTYRLFNLQADPHELLDLAKSPEHQQRLETLRELLAQQQERYADRLVSGEVTR
ncbi:MAG: sulfatase-like hydrolase/transferase [Opitutaceae bacterium]